MSVSGIAQNFYQNYITGNRNVSSRKAAEADNFAEKMQKTAASRSAQIKSNSSAWAGDMVVSQPPNYSGFTVNNQ